MDIPVDRVLGNITFREKKLPFPPGDFRLTLEETKRLRPLHCGQRYMVHSHDISSVLSFSCSCTSVLDIKTLYVDTTFCHPLATDIPSRVSLV